MGFSLAKEPTTSSIQAFNQGMFHLFSADPKAIPDLAQHYFASTLSNRLRTSSETNFYEKTHIETRFILKWGADYIKGHLEYINATRLAFILVYLNHPLRQDYIPKLLVRGIRDKNPVNLFFMALYHYRQPYGINSINNARGVLGQISDASSVPKAALLSLVNRDTHLFESLPKLSYHWTSGVVTETISMEKARLKRVTYSKQTMAFMFGVQYLLKGDNKAAELRFRGALDPIIDPPRAYAFLEFSTVPYSDEERALILGVIATQSEHQDYAKVLYKLALICLYQPYDLDFGFQSLGVQLLEFLELTSNLGVSDLNLYRYRSYLPGIDSQTLNLIDPAIQKLRDWEMQLLTCK